MIHQEYAFEQFYQVTIDESKIEQGYDDEERERFRRMLNAISANEDALWSVMRYQVLAEHEASMGSPGYIEEDGHSKDYGFVEMLISTPHVMDQFTQQDKDYLLDLHYRHIEGYKKWKQGLIDEDDDALFDLDLQVQPLKDCFIVTPSGWGIVQIERSGK